MTKIKELIALLCVLCILLALLLTAAYTPFFQELSRAFAPKPSLAEVPAPGATPSPAQLTGTAKLCAAGELKDKLYNYRCDRNVLKFNVCEEGLEKSKEIDCTKISIEEFVGFCNPAMQTMEGIRAECDLKPAVLAPPAAVLPSPSPTPTPILLPPPLPLSELQLASCGDLVCDPNEKCSFCPQDCGCSSDYYCAREGVCLLREACGDGNCTAKEKSEGNCCSDCGCSAGSVCNEFTGSCMAQPKISEAELNKTTASALKRYAMSEEALMTVRDSYYEDKAVKELVFNCDLYGEYDFPCRIILVVNEEGEILEEYRVM